jgi:hypothetical protein
MLTPLHDRDLASSDHLDGDRIMLGTRVDESVVAQLARHLRDFYSPDLPRGLDLCMPGAPTSGDRGTYATMKRFKLLRSADASCYEVTQTEDRLLPGVTVDFPVPMSFEKG